MAENKPTISISFEGFDPLGLKSAGEISKEVTQSGIDGIKTFLNLTCKPLLQELGLAGGEYLRNWRLTNVVNMLEKAQGRLSYDFKAQQLVIDPRVAFQIVEHASIISNENLQDMWAGLFASSCNTYEEDENIFFIDILKRLTSSQVKLLNYLCQNSRKTINVTNLKAHKEGGAINQSGVIIKYDDVKAIMETKSSLKVDSEINALEAMSLIEFPNSTTVPQYTPVQKIIYGKDQSIKPSLITILLYVKCQGSSETPFNYFREELISNYYNSYGEYLTTPRNQILENLGELAEIGQQFERQIVYGSNSLDIKDITWSNLQDEEWNRRLRGFAVFRFLTQIDRTIPVIINDAVYGSFNFKDGIAKF